MGLESGHRYMTGNTGGSRVPSGPVGSGGGWCPS